MEQENNTEKPMPLKRRLNRWKISSFVIGLLLLLSLTNSGFQFGTGAASLDNEDEVAETALDFINTALLQGQAAATLSDITTENGLYKLTVNVQGQDTPIYVTGDATLMFLQAIPLGEVPATTPGADGADGTDAAPSQQQAPPGQEDVPTSATPKVDLFVMSHCPYGTQMEKGILPVLLLLGDKIDFDLRFVYYAMHADTEIEEQIYQHCIEEEQNELFLTYLTCFLEAGDRDGCLTETNVDVDSLEQCVTATDEEYGIWASYEDQSTWLNGKFPIFAIDQELNTQYGVGGSPTLIVNDVKVQSGRDSTSLLTAICGAFDEAPEECNTTLEPGTPAAGFGWDASGSANVAACGV